MVEVLISFIAGFVICFLLVKAWDDFYIWISKLKKNESKVYEENIDYNKKQIKKEKRFRKKMRELWEEK